MRYIYITAQYVGGGVLFTAILVSGKEIKISAVERETVRCLKENVTIQRNLPYSPLLKGVRGMSYILMFYYNPLNPPFLRGTWSKIISLNSYRTFAYLAVNTLASGTSPVISLLSLLPRLHYIYNRCRNLYPYIECRSPSQCRRQKVGLLW